MTHGFGITPFDAAAILIVLAATLGYLNHRFLRLPQSIGLTIMGAIASLIVVGLDRLLPASSVGHDIVRFIAGIDFHPASQRNCMLWEAGWGSGPVPVIMKML